MPERPRFYLITSTTNNVNYETILDVGISTDARGISYFTIAMDPDPNALYRITIGSIMTVNELELTAVWSLELPHLTSGVYMGFRPGDRIVIQHRSPNATLIKTGVTLAFNEVVEYCV